MQAASAIDSFLEVLANRGHFGDVVWLEYGQMHLGEDRLFVNLGAGFVGREVVEAIFDRYSAELERGATFMLVGKRHDKVCCTLLLDSFGSTGDLEVIEDHPNFWCDPYVSKLKVVTSKLR